MSQTALSIEQKLSLAQSFTNHPIQNEPLDYKIKYINVLEWFVNKFAANDIFAKKFLENYKTGLLGNDVMNYQYSDELDGLLKVVAKLRLIDWHWFSYRYLLLIDLMFLCAFNDSNKAILVLNEYKKQLKLWFLKNKYFKNMNAFTAELYNGVKSDLKLDAVEDAVFKWGKNLNFIMKQPSKMLVTANMSAGKSTLINALVGKRIVKTQNMVCTSKLHYIYNKAFEDGFNYKIDGDVYLDADSELLLNNSIANSSNVIAVSTYFRSYALDKPFCLIDTPGVNYSGNSSHREITQNAVLQKEYDKLVYVMNAEYLGTSDEYKYLKFIADNVKDREIIIVINKLDRFNQSEDSIPASLKMIWSDLSKIGLTNFILCPVSAYAGLLAKEKLWHENIGKRNCRQLEIFQLDFEEEINNLSLYYPKMELIDLYSKVSSDDRGAVSLSINSGIVPLEKIIFNN